MSIAASTLDVQNLSTGDFDLAVGYHLLCIRKKNDGTFQREFCQLTANTLFGLGATLPSLFPFADFAGAQALADETTARAAADTTNANTAAGKITADPSVTFYRDRATTTSATATVIRSLPMAVNSQIFIDVIAQFRDSATNLTGGYIWATLSFARGASGAPVALGTIDILESHLLLTVGVSPVPSGIAFVSNAATNNVDITISGKTATSVKWSLRTTADRDP